MHERRVLRLSQTKEQNACNNNQATNYTMHINSKDLE